MGFLDSILGSTVLGALGFDPIGGNIIGLATGDTEPEDLLTGLLPAAGAAIGNLLVPGVGGAVGGAIGSAGSTAIQGGSSEQIRGSAISAGITGGIGGIAGGVSSGLGAGAGGGQSAIPPQLLSGGAGAATGGSAAGLGAGAGAGASAVALQTANALPSALFGGAAGAGAVGSGAGLADAVAPGPLNNFIGAGVGPGAGPGATSVALQTAEQVPGLPFGGRNPRPTQTGFRPPPTLRDHLVAGGKEFGASILENLAGNLVQAGLADLLDETSLPPAYQRALSNSFGNAAFRGTRAGIRQPGIDFTRDGRRAISQEVDLAKGFQHADRAEGHLTNSAVDQLLQNQDRRFEQNPAFLR